MWIYYHMRRDLHEIIERQPRKNTGTLRHQGQPLSAPPAPDTGSTALSELFLR